MASILKLDIVTQEKRLLTVETKQITAETAMGEITILPGHVPLVTRLTEGLLRFLLPSGEEEIVAIFGGFLELNGEGECSVLADSAVRADDIDIAKVEEAKKDAEAALQDKTKEQEFVLAEAALRRTALELKAADRKTRHSQT
ncbi:MAG: ATP synthase F1 subunit epsilon [bacterium]